MAGHSKWANIQHRKKRQDAKRGKLFTRLIREVSVAAREGGGDPEANPRLRLAMDKANAANVPKDTIDRAIKKASGESDDVRYEDVRYEGYAPGGVAVMVDCLTDNRNRTVAEVRHAFTKYDGNLGTDGSVGYLFNNLGVISFEPSASEEKVMELALELGAEDIIDNEDGSVDVLTTPDAFGVVRQGMLKSGLKPAAAEITMRPETEIEVDGDAAEKVLKLIEALEELDDVQDVYSNADFPEEILADKPMPRILGIDPGSRITGYGIIDSRKNRNVHVISGCIKAGDGDFPGRLRIIFDNLVALIEEHAPEEIAIETVFMSQNADSALKLGQARGAALCACLARALPVSEYSPREVKLATVGTGKADKVQVQHMVRVLLNLGEIVQADTADALAVALCHSHSRTTRVTIARAGGEA